MDAGLVGTGRKALVLVVLFSSSSCLLGLGWEWELVVGMTFNEGNDYGGFKDLFSSIW